MRIISQDGMFDVSYEKVIVQVTGGGDNNIIAYTNEGQSDCLVMASYSTETKAKKAMEMLHEVYTGLPIIMQNVEITDKNMDMFKKWKKQEIYIQSGEQSKVEHINNRYFQFPADDEIEV